ncbi:uncharacterized protein OCT59_026694 [Rhizophagus irregularis]|uniref:uncharacterized protein n=1 Tax=Rhizophagus irregularis TaxID=588596 RepID=UPI0033272963|nr:hypothetical protein OCT59_026694 [Rhizophagus irregularis]
MRSATAIIMGTIIYEAPVIKEVTQKESSPGKHIINLEDISLTSMNRSSTNAGQSLNLRSSGCPEKFVPIKKNFSGKLSRV